MIAGRPAGVVALALVLVLAACQGDDDAADGTAPPTGGDAVETDDGATSTTAPSTTALADAPAPEPAGASVTVDADVDSSLAAGPVTWTLSVTNVTEGPVTLTFPTGQPGDAVLLEGTDEVHRWSDGRFFTQAMTRRRLAPGESTEVVLPDDLSSVEPGRYTLRLDVAVVGPPEPFEQSVRITSP